MPVSCPAHSSDSAEPPWSSRLNRLELSSIGEGHRSLGSRARLERAVRERKGLQGVSLISVIQCAVKPCRTTPHSARQRARELLVHFVRVGIELARSEEHTSELQSLRHL